MALISPLGFSLKSNYGGRKRTNATKPSHYKVEARALRDNYCESVRKPYNLLSNKATKCKVICRVRVLSYARV